MGQVKQHWQDQRDAMSELGQFAFDLANDVTREQLYHAFRPEDPQATIYPEHKVDVKDLRK